MPDQRVYKPGDKFTMPVTFQLLKAMGHEDRVFYLCAPVDDSQHAVALKDPFFLICLEGNETMDAQDVPEVVIHRAFNFINLDQTLGEETEGEDGKDKE